MSLIDGPRFAALDRGRFVLVELSRRVYMLPAFIYIVNRRKIKRELKQIRE